MSGKVMIVLILEKEHYLNELLIELNDVGIKSATVTNSSGMMGHLSALGEEQIISTLRPLFTPAHTENKTIFMIIDDSMVDIARKTVRKVLGDLSQPETGILFGVPLLFTEGIRDYD